MSSSSVFSSVVVAARLHALVAQLVLLHDLADALGRAGVDGEHALGVLVADALRVDARELLVELGAGGDVLYSIGLPESLIALIAPSMRGWMFSEPGVAMNSADLARGDEVDDALAHLDAGQEQVLADVGQPRVGASAL